MFGPVLDQFSKGLAALAPGALRLPPQPRCGRCLVHVSLASALVFHTQDAELKFHAD